MINKKHKDFLLRKVEELSGALARLIGMASNQENEDILEESRTVLSGYFEKDLVEMNQAHWQEWLAENEYDTRELIVLADLLELRVQTATTEEEAAEDRQKYDQLKQYIIKERNTFPFHWAGK